MPPAATSTAWPTMGRAQSLRVESGAPLPVSWATGEIHSLITMCNYSTKLDSKMLDRIGSEMLDIYFELKMVNGEFGGVSPFAMSLNLSLVSQNN